MLGVIRWLSKEVEMKKPCIQIIFLVLFVAMFVSCETLHFLCIQDIDQGSGDEPQQGQEAEDRMLMYLHDASPFLSAEDNHCYGIKIQPQSKIVHLCIKAREFRL